MRIGIDISPLALPYPNGTATYTKNLIYELARLDAKNHYILFSPKSIHIPQQKNFDLIVLPSIPFFKRKVILPFLIKTNMLDVFHFLNPFGVLFYGNKKILTTVQDELVYKSFFARRLIKRSDIIICPSLAVKMDFIKKSLVPDEKIIVIGHGVECVFSPNMVYDKKNGIICLADYSPRKNFYIVLRSYKHLPLQIRKRHPLYIVLTSTANKDTIIDEITRMHLENFIELYFNLTSEQMAVLYNRARLLVYPSLYEGFGLPIIESMASGCPVVTSNYGAMKEVAGNAAHLVHPQSVEQLSNAMLHILTDTKYHKELTRRGLERAMQFSWVQTAKKTLGVYEELFQSSGSNSA
jgi:glycosyltransferase involved in cell wall biosynthesis